MNPLHIKVSTCLPAALTLCALFSSDIFAASPTHKTAVPQADYVFEKGDIYTVHYPQPWAQAVAVSGNKIIYVGDSQGAAAYKGPRTKVVDLKGHMMMPGIIDAHNHLMMAVSRPGISLRDCNTKAEILALVRKYAKDHPELPALWAWGWRLNMFGENMPTKEDLDSAVSDRPVILFNEDSHNMWANSLALKNAGITAKTPDPKPTLSYYKRNKDGEPSGIVIEVAATLSVAVPNGYMGEKQVHEAIDYYLKQATENGITACHEMGILLPDEKDAYKAYDILVTKERQNKLPIRVVGAAHKFGGGDDSYTTHLPLLKKWSQKYRTELIKITGFKIWVDGGYLSHSAMLLEPYVDKPDLKVETGWTTERLTRWIEAVQGAGFDFHTHLEGDLSGRRVLDAIEAVQRKHGRQARRHCIHHAFLMHPDDIPRYRKLGVLLNTQPLWMTNWTGGYYESNLAQITKQTLDKNFFRHKAVLESGVPVTFSGDGIDEELSPMNQIYCATTRKSPLVKNDSGFPPLEYAFNMEQAVRAYTINGAYQMRLEDKVGSIEVGKCADFCILDKNLFTMPSEEIPNNKFLFTMMNGRITYKHPSFKITR